MTDTNIQDLDNALAEEVQECDRRGDIIVGLMGGVPEGWSIADVIDRAEIIIRTVRELSKGTNKP